MAIILAKSVAVGRCPRCQTPAAKTYTQGRTVWYVYLTITEPHRIPSLMCLISSKCDLQYLAVLDSPRIIELPDDETTKNNLDVVKDKKKLDQNHLQDRAGSSPLQSQEQKRTKNKDDEISAKEEYELECYFRNVHFFAGRNYFVPSYLRDNKSVEELKTNFIPTKWNQESESKGLQISEDKLEIMMNSPETSMETALTDRKMYDMPYRSTIASIRADHPMNPRFGLYYFEVTVLSGDSEKCPMGIGFSTKDVPLLRLPGWEPGSWGYHQDDGHSFCSQSSGKPYGPTFSTGDVIGCGVDFGERTAFFTKNGFNLG